MHERLGSRDPFIEQRRGDAPAVPDSQSLDRVRAHALARARERDARPTKVPVRRIAGGLAVAAAIMALAFLAAPRQSSSAFATDRAAAALVPAHGVLHTKATFTDAGTTDQFGETPVRQQTWEVWQDAERGLMRNEVREPDGTISELGVIANGIYRSMGSQMRLDLEKRAYVRVGVDQIGEMAADTQISIADGGLVDRARAALLSGEAVVKGEPTIDGDAYWDVELTQSDNLLAGMNPAVIRAVFRKSDYRPKRLQVSESGVNGNGRITMTTTLAYETWETLRPEDLPADFFSLDAPVEAALPGTKIEKRYDAAPLP
jgi:hypothetical protein